MHLRRRHRPAELVIEEQAYGICHSHQIRLEFIYHHGRKSPRSDTHARPTTGLMSP